MKGIGELLRPFAESIHAKTSALQRLQLTERQQSRFREAVSDDIKKCTNFLTPEVSVAAKQKAESKAVDLFSKDWHEQHQFDPGRGVFHFEHVVPVLSIRKMCERAHSSEEILSILLRNLRVAWILKEEDRKLSSLGYRSKRPDPNEAYRHAGIKLLSKV